MTEFAERERETTNNNYNNDNNTYISIIDIHIHLVRFRTTSRLSFVLWVYIVFDIVLSLRAKLKEKNTFVRVQHSFDWITDETSSN